MKLSKTQEDIAKVLTEGGKIVAEFGVDRGYSGTAKARYYYSADLIDADGRHVRRVPKSTVKALFRRSLLRTKRSISGLKTFIAS